MRTFEIGKRYNTDKAIAFEVIKRTAKFVTVVEIQHAGRYNEKRGEEKKVKTYEYPKKNCEMFWLSHYEVEA